MNDKVIKKTQDTLGKIVKKPPLTDKLLNKPPFRFLHDIVTSIIKSTGFMKGLYADSELSSENVKDKDSKIAFLQKAIDFLALVSGKAVAAKPSKIVAGHEPEKTNEFLQCLAEAISKKANNDDYVKKFKAGDRLGSSADGGSKPPSGTKKDRESSSDRRKRKDEKDEGEEKEKRHRSKEERGKDKDRERGRDKEHREGSRDKEHREKSRDDDREGRDRDKSRDKDRGRDRGERDKDRERRRRHREDKEKEEAKGAEPEDNQESETGADQDAPAKIPRPSSAKGSRRRHRGDEDEERQRLEDGRKEESELNGTVGEDDLPPQVAAARRMARPSSARPAPPKIKKNEVPLDEPPVLGSGGSNVPNVIVDKGGDSDDDDLFMAKEEDIPTTDDIPSQHHADLDDNAEHGGLVKKILETKKELEGGSQQPQAIKKTEIEKPAVNDAARRKEREMVQKEIDKLRGSIQTLTRSANPLGKIMDYVQEDLDQMQKELEMWKRENKQNALALQREQSITENSVEPLKAELGALDNQIADQLDLIAAVKSNILQGDNKIEKMLGSITKS